jgi:hypothetical protein
MVEFISLLVPYMWVLIKFYIFITKKQKSNYGTVEKSNSLG